MCGEGSGITRTGCIDPLPRRNGDHVSGGVNRKSQRVRSDSKDRSLIAAASQASRNNQNTSPFVKIRTASGATDRFSSPPPYPGFPHRSKQCPYNIGNFPCLLIKDNCTVFLHHNSHTSTNLYSYPNCFLIMEIMVCQFNWGLSLFEGDLRLSHPAFCRHNLSNIHHNFGEIP